MNVHELKFVYRVSKDEMQGASGGPLGAKTPSKIAPLAAHALVPQEVEWASRLVQSALALTLALTNRAWQK